jgi:hypothetical protein
MPPYYLTAQLPYILLGTDAINDPDLALDPKLTHEKKARVFYQVDSQVVAEKLLDLFKYGTPAPPADMQAPIGTPEALRNLLEWAGQPVFGVVDVAELDWAQRVFCRERIEVLEKIEAVGDWDPGVWAEGGLPHDNRTQTLMRLRWQARQWEPLVRDELGVDNSDRDAEIATGGKPGDEAVAVCQGKLVASPVMPETEYFLWITLGAGWTPEEICFYSLRDLSDAKLVSRLCRLFEMKYSADATEVPPWDQPAFSYTAVTDLDPDRVLLLREELAGFRKPHIWDPNEAVKSFNTHVYVVRDNEKIASLCFQQAAVWEEALRTERQQPCGEKSSEDALHDETSVRSCVFSIRRCTEAKPHLRHLLNAIKRHRLVFLWYAQARCWIPWGRGRWQILDRSEVYDPDVFKQLRGEKSLPAEVLLNHAKGIEDFVYKAYELFGTGAGGAKIDPEGWMEGGESEYWPQWLIGIDGVAPLEASSDEICRLAITVLGQHPSDWACIGIVEKCRGVARPGFPRWSTNRVSWQYLEELDNAIVSLNHAIWEEETKSGSGGPSQSQQMAEAGGAETQDAAKGTIASSSGPTRTAANGGVEAQQAEVRTNGAEALNALLEDANYCLMALGDMRQDYLTMAAAESRMEGGGEDWHFADDHDKSNYREAKRRVDSRMRVLPEQLLGVLNWGLQHGMDVARNLGWLISDKASSGVKADDCARYELDVRAVTNAILVEQTRERGAGTRGGARRKSRKAGTAHVDVPADQCYGELEMDGKGQFVLRILLRRGDQPGKRPEVCKPIFLQKQAYRILAEGIENARRLWIKTEKINARNDGDPKRALECEPPPGHCFDVEWSQDDLAFILCKKKRFKDLGSAQPDAIKSAMRRLRKLVTFDKDRKCGLVSEANETHTRRATIRLRLQGAGQP